MADETNTTETADAATVETTAPVKKQRAPRRAKATAVSAVAAQPAEPEKVVKERKKRAPKTTEPAISTGRKSAKASARKGRVISTPVKATVANTPVSAADEMAELLQLEEENKRLRQSLAEKLRAENADLRERLGLA